MNCNRCGNPLEPMQTTCSFCGATTEQAVKEPAVVQKPENTMGGVIGAVIGAILGAIAIVLFNQIGRVAALSGVVLAFCTLKGYELLGGRLTTKGIIISIALMLITPYFADRACWAIAILEVYGELGITFFDAFAVVPELIEYGDIVMSDYIAGLLMVYVFTALGAVGTVISEVKKRKS